MTGSPPVGMVRGQKENNMKPIITKKDYMKWGFVPTRFQAFLCPNCKTILSAGPEYQPRFCAECGTNLDFTGIVYEEEERIA